MRGEGEMWEGCGNSRRKDRRKGVRSTVLEAPPGAGHGSPGMLTCIFLGQPKTEGKGQATPRLDWIRGWEALGDDGGKMKNKTGAIRHPDKDTEG